MIVEYKDLDDLKEQAKTSLHARFELSIAYVNGRFGRSNKVQAVKLLENLIENDFAEAYFELAHFYSQGFKGKNIDDAIDLCKMAYEKGHDRAANHVAWHYKEKNDEKQYVKWLNLEIKRDGPQSIYAIRSLADFYINKKSYKLAEKCLINADRKGCQESMFKLSEL